MWVGSGGIFDFLRKRYGIMVIELEAPTLTYFQSVLKFRPVIYVVLSSVLFIDRSVIVAVHHPVNSQNVSLILLDNTLRLEYNSIPSCHR